MHRRECNVMHFVREKPCKKSLRGRVRVLTFEECDEHLEHLGGRQPIEWVGFDRLNIGLY